MYEVGLLLAWAASKPTPEPRKVGRIVFFAALAEWKSFPEATLVSKLDEMELHALVEVVIAAHDGSEHAAVRLRELLNEKRALTDAKNLDPAGLKRLAEVVAGVRRGGGRLSSAFQEALDRAHQSISTGTRSPEDTINLHVENARTKLDEAAKALTPSS